MITHAVALTGVAVGKNQTQTVRRARELDVRRVSTFRVSENLVKMIESKKALCI